MDVASQSATQRPTLKATSNGTRRRLRLHVRGIVQGVGFRPFVYQLAARSSLAGFVLNTGDGVTIEVEGESSAVDNFLQALPREGPPLVSIAHIASEEVDPSGSETFEIRSSQSSGAVFSPVPADVSVCDACLAETRNPTDRRFEYAFTNCTNCGPRYSIILDVPYDRAQTTMASFALCDACRAEYEDPTNRRFHAQPNACPVCGPHLWLTDRCGKQAPLHSARTVLEAVVNMLRSGGVVAWKGLSGYQLACNARDDEAVAELRRRKHRSAKAFAVMVRDASVAQALCEVSDSELAVLTGRERPIVLLPRRAGANLAASVAPDTPLLGVMLPSTPMHELLFRIFEEKCGPGSVLVMTSGNRSDEPIVIDEAAAQQQLRAVADAFVHHNRPIHTRVDDSVVRLVGGAPMLLRRARGYAPIPLSLAGADREALACGAQQKSTLCLTKAGSALLSQHLGDLENFETLQFFEQTLQRMQRLFHVTPQAVAHDLHPNYLSTQFAIKMNLGRRIPIQHHHAHIASCMAEHGLAGPVIGVAWDGTGLGSDGTIWGGEFLIADLAGFERFAHLRNVPLAGGDAAVREPWRLARSYLHDAFGDAFDNVAARGLSCNPSVPEASVRIMDAMLKRRVQTVETSSCGRLFDAVASLAGLFQTVSFEGQAAMALEAIAGSAEEVYSFTIEGHEPALVDMRPMVLQIVDEVQRGEPVSRISARFHNTLISVVENICTRARIQTGLTHVCLSGGCFQNMRLLRGCLAALRSSGFEVFFQQRVPTNDGGISFGQAAIACELLRRGV